MKTIRINDQVSISDITMGAGALSSPDRDLILDGYLSRGGNCFDTARIYGNGENDGKLGRWLNSRQLRPSVCICAKGCHPALSDMFTPRLSPQDIRGDLETSLRELGTDYADLYILHRDWPKMPVEDIMPTLHALVTEGKALAVGASNWTVARIAQANAFASANGLTPFAVSQVHFGLAQTTAAATGDITHVPMNDAEYPWYEQTQLPVMAFSSQAQGFFSIVAAGGTLEGHKKRYYGHLPQNFQRASRLTRLAQELGTNESALALAYVRDCSLNTSALCSFSRMEQFENSMDALRLTLTPQQVRYLESGENLL